MSQFIPNDPGIYYRLIKWLYAHTLARNWWLYKKISLRKRRVVDLGAGITAVKSFWRMAREGELDDDCSVRIDGVISEYAPLVPGAIASIDPADWKSIIDNNVEKVLQVIHSKFSGAASSVSPNFDLRLAPIPKGGKELDMAAYFKAWARVVVKYAIFATDLSAVRHSSQAKSVIEQFRNIVTDDIVSSISTLSAPHGVIHCPRLPDLGEYRYLGLSQEIADFGIPMLVRNDVYTDHLQKPMGEQGACNAEVLINLQPIPHFPVPSGMSELGGTIDAFAPARIAGFIDSDEQVRRVRGLGEIEWGRIWASYLFHTDKNDFVIHLPWRTRLNRRGIHDNVYEIQTFVSDFAEISGFQDYELLAHFDQYYNWFYAPPRISINDYEVKELAQAMVKGS